MDKFNLRAGEEYIELNNLLKMLGWAATGGEAKLRIDDGEVLVNDQKETRRRKKLRSGDVITFGEERITIA
ncbi:MAG: RNA-binding S4 domain-containing protein [Cyclobacteriaceae bacterium]